MSAAPDYATILQDADRYADFLGTLRAEIMAQPVSLGTASGRKAVASRAFRATRAKTGLDAAGKKLNEEALAKIGVIDAKRRQARADFDALAVEARQPLTDWEAAEAAKCEAAKDIELDIAGFSVVGPDDGSNYLGARIGELEAVEIDPDLFGDRLELVQHQKQQGLEILRQACDRAKKHEADQAELARLREESERRVAEEAERLRAEREAAEAKRRADEAAAAEKARKEAEARRIQEAREAAEREAKEAAERALAEERNRAATELAKIEAAHQAEREAAAKVEAKRRAAEEAAAAEKARREADREHQSKVMTAAKDAIMEHGPCDEAAAKAIVLAIRGGLVPHVKMEF